MTVLNLKPKRVRASKPNRKELRDAQEDLGRSMRLTPKEATALQRQIAQEERAARKRPSAVRQWMDNTAAARAKTLEKPGPRGWNVEGGGPTGYVEPPVEAQGTSVQVCGLWPFVAGSSSPMVGVPLGNHLRRGTTVCADPIMWFLANLVLQPSAFVLGRPGLGKSSLMRRIVTVLQAWGVTPLVLSDTKPDYVPLIRAMDGQVIEVARGRGHLNPLDLGPLVQHLREIPDPRQRHAALEEMRGRRLTILSGLISLVLDRKLEAHETALLSETMRVLDPDLENAPVIGDVGRLIESRHDRLRAIALDRGDDGHYDKRVAGLLDACMALGPNGPFSDLFSAPTSEHLQPGVPAVFDISGIDDGDKTMGAAVQTVCWGLGSAMVSAEKHLATGTGQDQRHYLLIMDEMWRMLRASEQMVYFLDSLTRLNRTLGIGQIMCTHTMGDLKLSSDHLTEIAWGFVERSAMVFLGGLAEREMGNLEEVFMLSQDEKSMITDWSAEGGINPDTNRAASPPGLGKFILKIGKKPGIPFQSVMTSIEGTVNDTNQAWTKNPRPRDRTAGGSAR
ncbi:MAG: hypothetical protein ACTHZ6_15745 [Brevibacterium aurantiacum]|uniref:hypothetical protein n=1 Tax=Brevibacterium aurantiacum TaxID=273384 RepID=UPI003F93F136